MTVQVSYGAVDFSTLGELSDAVKRADVHRYARKRERTGVTRRARMDRHATSGSPPLGQPGNEPVGKVDLGSISSSGNVQFTASHRRAADTLCEIGAAVSALSRYTA